ncbi:MAG: copper homeostasis protein CutC [Bacteroidota bacterium]|nr:copper homeostasis protein CutC [Bacteroidota bacterium]
MASHKLEIACFNIESAIIAQQGGADRVELCDDISVGGITPLFETIASVRKKIQIDLYIMIRPRGGDFVYSEDEYEEMKMEILLIKYKQVNGFVFGILNEDGTIDKERNKELVELAHPLPCTFHRAFDEVEDPKKALEDLIECGFKTILTSGQKTNATEGINDLTELIKQAGDRIIIMPGGGVRSSNIEKLKKLNVPFYHSSAITDKTETASLEEVKELKRKLNA